MDKHVERFTDTVQNYIKYRPSYPKDILQILIDECELTKNQSIADIGSGTGLLSKLFLDNGNIVYGVEPNQAMREAGELLLKNYPNFISCNGTAETTSLHSHSIDFVTAGTAFHWFDAALAKEEFKRILKSPGWVALIWNVRDIEASQLLRDYEQLIIKYGKDYQSSNAEKFDKTLMKSFFSPFPMKIHIIKNIQYFNWEGFKGRLLSASYSLRPGDKYYEEMINELKKIFDRYQQNDTVEFLYATKMYFGRLI